MLFILIDNHTIFFILHWNKRSYQNKKLQNCEFCAREFWASIIPDWLFLTFRLFLAFCSKILDAVTRDDCVN